MLNSSSSSTDGCTAGFWLALSFSCFLSMHFRLLLSTATLHNHCSHRDLLTLKSVSCLLEVFQPFSSIRNSPCRKTCHIQRCPRPTVNFTETGRWLMYWVLLLTCRLDVDSGRRLLTSLISVRRVWSLWEIDHLLPLVRGSGTVSRTTSHLLHHCLCSGKKLKTHLFQQSYPDIIM